MDTRSRMFASCTKLDELLKSMKQLGIEAADGAKVADCMTELVAGLPTHGSLRMLRSHAKSITCTARDLAYAVDKEVLSHKQALAELQGLVAQASELRQLVDELPEGFAEAKAKPLSVDAQAHSGGSDLEALEEATTLAADVEVDQKMIDSYYKRVRKVPSEVTKNDGVVLLSNIPLVVIGLFGEPLEQVRRLLKASQFVEGYVVLDNQLLLGIDSRNLVKEYGERKAKDIDFVANVVRGLLEEHNQRSSTPLVLVNDYMPQRKGSVVYWWVMPERILDRIIAKVRNFGQEWAFPSKHELHGTKPHNKLMPERVELVFKFAIRGLDLKEIAEKTGYRPDLILRLLRGEEAPDMTRELRKRYAAALKQQQGRLNAQRLRQEVQEKGAKVKPVERYIPDGKVW